MTDANCAGARILRIRLVKLIANNAIHAKLRCRTKLETVCRSGVGQSPPGMSNAMAWEKRDALPLMEKIQKLTPCEAEALVRTNHGLVEAGDDQTRTRAEFA